MSPHQNLLIRADASETIGNGHVMRMIALAQAWQQRGGTVTVVSCHCPEPLVNRLRSENIQFKKLTVSKPGAQDDADATAGLAADTESSAVVLDGYVFDERYQDSLSQQVRPLLVVDDDCQWDSYHCDLILNQNLGASGQMYSSVCAAAKLLMGLKFSLLRKEFLGRHDFERDFTKVRRLLVTLGGSNVSNVLVKITAALAQIKNLELETRVLIGGSNHDWGERRSLSQNQHRISILPYVSDMADQYRWADMAIVAGGSSNWEMCLFGLPRLIVVLADNQRRVASQLSQFGSALSLGEASELTIASIANAISGLATDTEMRMSLSSRSKVLVDGLGAKRVVDEIVSAILRSDDLNFACEDLKLRSATMADSNMLLCWRNDVSTRHASRNQEEVTLEQHQQWLSETLNGQNRQLLIAESNQTPVGTIRLDFVDDIEISWTVAPSARGKGWGKKMVTCVAQYANCDLVACVRTENLASRKIAVAAGFEPAGQKDDLLIYRRSTCR